MGAITVWAPNATAVRIRIGGRDQPMTAAGDGWWSGSDLPPDTDYAFVLDDEDEPLSDPRSRRQPDGVHGPSRTYDEAASPAGPGIPRGPYPPTPTGPVATSRQQ